MGKIIQMQITVSRSNGKGVVEFENGLGKSARLQIWVISFH
jgi:hypothetical protein